MSAITIQQNAIKDLLGSWLIKQVEPKDFTWLQQQQQKLASGAAPRVFFTAFSAVPRYLGKQQLQLSSTEIQQAQAKCLGWLPQFWRSDQAARCLLVLSLAQAISEAQYLKTLKKVFVTADVEELVALYQMLPLLPYPEQYRLQAAEGIRTNMTVVFEAVALRNPYPAVYCDELAWNQMVLKALFVGSPLCLIQGLEARTNPTLAQMLLDYARERWAAKRSVSPELWRAMGTYADETIVADWEKILADSDLLQQAAVALACSRSSLPEARHLLLKYPDLKTAIDSGNLTWAKIATVES
ncbi:MAG TPA: EboA family metabolite traffic protein [Xenococcaceae cyanobacterium]